MKAATRRFTAACVLSLRFVVAAVRSGWDTARVILHGGRRTTPGFVDYTFVAMSDNATTLLACLICLTPGTTAVDVDAAGGRMRLHMLDLGGKDAALQEIRERFEPLVRSIFGEVRR